MFGHGRSALTKRFHHEVVFVEFESAALWARRHVIGMMDDVEQDLLLVLTNLDFAHAQPVNPRVAYPQLSDCHPANRHCTDRDCTHGDCAKREGTDSGCADCASASCLCGS
jgi:hypothetical protein